MMILYSRHLVTPSINMKRVFFSTRRKKSNDNFFNQQSKRECKNAKKMNNKKETFREVYEKFIGTKNKIPVSRTDMYLKSSKN